jgi:hypothetical protein
MLKKKKKKKVTNRTKKEDLGFKEILYVEPPEEMS